MREKDLRPGLDSVQHPALVVHRSSKQVGRAPDDRRAPGSSPARRITRAERYGPPARCSDLQGELSRLEQALAGHHPVPARIERVLATVLFTDIVDSTPRAVAVGDTAWRQLLDSHDLISRSAVADCGGRLVKGTGDGLLATFDAPVSALRCAKALRAMLSHAGIAIRAGVHTGEVELRGADIAGIGVHIAARIAARAASGELLASRTVKDLVAGSEYRFTSRGVHSLKGVPEHWELLAVS